MGAFLWTGYDVGRGDIDEHACAEACALDAKNVPSESDRITELFATLETLDVSGCCGTMADDPSRTKSAYECLEHRKIWAATLMLAALLIV